MHEKKMFEEQQPSRLYTHRDGTVRATIMDDLDLVFDRGVVTINGPIGGQVQFDLDDAADLAAVLAEIAALRGPTYRGSREESE
ncbi:hypothetical protein [Curtobacterium sp. 458]|uniref:hypothetical protein n=1 Tax=Curtobacterium sp. 458 TaxID=3050069 RepID=UPI0025B4691A|nr:hypothetical protein [Curtobacterium sp. 458]WJY00887.1 hypothetical protein QPJ90_04100 [Curtobacterium sp. 458]